MRKLILLIAACLCFTVASQAQVTYTFPNVTVSNIGTDTLTSSSIEVGELNQNGFTPYVTAFASGEVDTTGVRVQMDFSPDNSNWYAGTVNLFDSLAGGVTIDSVNGTNLGFIYGSRYARFRVWGLLGNDATVDVKFYLKAHRPVGVRY